MESAVRGPVGTRSRSVRRLLRGCIRSMSEGRGFSVEEDHNVVTVIPDMRGGRNGGNLTIQVPVEYLS